MAAQAVTIEFHAHALARCFGDAFGRAIEEMRRTLSPILVVDPAHLQDCEIKVVFEHALDRPGLRALLRAQTLVEIEAVFALDMGADEGRIAKAMRADPYEGDLALGCRIGRRAFESVGHTRHLEVHFA